MPELPDLQVFRKNLEKKLAGKKLIKVEIQNTFKIDAHESTLQKTLVGKSLKTITREGKELFFYFDNNLILSFHLMLNGKFYFFNGSNSHSNKIIELLFEDKTGLVLTDKDNYANVKFNPEAPAVPDAYSKEFTTEYLKEGLKKRKLKNIKDLLIDQKFLRGIGNAYIDEILWAAKIHPLSKASKIPDEKIKELYTAINKTLTEAEQEIIKRDPEIISGEIRDFLKVHNSRLKHSPTGGTIKKEYIGNRITYYTDEQILYE